MNERILIKFKRDGKPVPLTSFSSYVPCKGDAGKETAGLVLDGETSAWPRGFALSLKPTTPGTEIAMDHVRRRLDWFNPKRYDLQASRDGDRLRLEGVDAEALPAGGYELDLRVSGLKFDQSVHRVRIPKSSQAAITLEEKPPKRRLTLNRTVPEFDEHPRRIITNSQLDNMPARDWIEKAEHRDRRKACLLNILAKLATAPTRKDPLEQHVKRVFFTDLERIYCAVRPEFFERLRRSTRFKRDGIIHPTHQRLLTRIPNTKRCEYTLHSYRQATLRSLQIVVAQPPENIADRTHYADMDIDLGNPGWDLRGFIIHIGQLLNPDKTDHLKLGEKLSDSELSDFFYYDVAKT